MDDISTEKKLGMLRMMVLIRRFELRMQANFKERTRAGEAVGAIHSYEGQEAVATGVSACLRGDDYVFSTHRGHGHALAKGADLNRVVAELMGRETGFSGGRGGSMHLFDPAIGLMGGNGIVGGGLPLVLGAAYSALYRNTDQVAVCYFGEGAASQGSFHESLNMASIMKYPILYVCENNLYAATTHAAQQGPTEDVANLAAGYGIPGPVIDGNDLGAVYQAAGAAVSRARSGHGPTLLECKTYRHRPHCMVIPEHRSRQERDSWKARDPIPRFEAKLLEAGTATRAEFDRMADEVEKRLDEAIEQAAGSPFPDPKSLTDGFWATE